MLDVAFALASSNNPFEIIGRPQHSVSDNITLNPAASNNERSSSRGLSGTGVGSLAGSEVDEMDRILVFLELGYGAAGRRTWAPVGVLRLLLELDESDPAPVDPVLVDPSVPADPPPEDPGLVLPVSSDSVPLEPPSVDPEPVLPVSPVSVPVDPESVELEPLVSPTLVPEPAE